MRSAELQQHWGSHLIQFSNVRTLFQNEGGSTEWKTSKKLFCSIAPKISAIDERWHFVHPQSGAQMSLPVGQDAAGGLCRRAPVLSLSNQSWLHCPCMLQIYRSTGPENTLAFIGSIYCLEKILRQSPSYQLFKKKEKCGDVLHLAHNLFWSKKISEASKML